VPPHLHLLRGVGVVAEGEAAKEDDQVEPGERVLAAPHDGELRNRDFLDDLAPPPPVVQHSQRISDLGVTRDTVVHC
jgi:hypothetical protein